MNDLFKQAIKILVLEDDPGDFGLIHAHLRRAGFDHEEAESDAGGRGETVVWAKTLAQGLDLARGGKPDVVLLDLSLPDSTGLATVRAMRAALPDAPLVVLTGNDDNNQALAALQAGAQDYLIKGRFDHDALGRAVRHALVRASLEARLRLFEVALNSAANAILITDIDARIEWANPAFVQLTGYSLEESLGLSPGFLMNSGRQSPPFFREMWEAILSGRVWRGELVNQRKDGSLYDASLIISPVIDGDGATRHFVAILQDITERKQIEDQIHQMAFSDPLTRLPNRRLLIDRLSQVMAASQRSGLHGALMFLDLDNFKPLNDAHGHEIGDLLLMEVSNRLKGCVRDMDTVARFGGDEFVVMISELVADKSESASQGGVIAEKIRASLAKPYVLEVRQEETAKTTVEHHCTASIGISLFSKNDSCQEDVLKRADAAMYQAKEAGRNLIRFYDVADA